LLASRAGRLSRSEAESYAEATSSKFHVRLSAVWCGVYAPIGNDV